jgi:glycosyltransferase involved in cell wall biosynthesis
MILHFLDSKVIGGIETHVETLVRAQNAAGHCAAVVLWRCHDHGQTLERFKKSGLRVINASGSVQTLCRILTRLRPSILHTHGYKGGIIGRLLARITGVAVVSTFHAGERGKFPVNLYQFVDEWTSVLGTRIAVSREIADSMPFVTKFVPNFVEVPELSSAPKVNEHISFVGRISHEKGPDIFGAIARARGDQSNFVMFGDGPLMGALKLKFGNFVRFNGFATDMEEVWKRTELLLMPSRNEGLPMAALEAMARGIPLAAAKVGALPDIVQHGKNGLLFDAENVDAAIAAVANWQSMSQREKTAMGAAARQTIQEKYSSATGLYQIMQAYRQAGWNAPASISSMVQSSSGR